MTCDPTRSPWWRSCGCGMPTTRTRHTGGDGANHSHPANQGTQDIPTSEDPYRSTPCGVTAYADCLLFGGRFGRYSGFVSSERHADPERDAPRYERVAELAQGGMAVLELARTVGAHGFEKYVAVKRISPKWADDPEFISMFLDEARLAAVLDHPNVVRVHDLGHDTRGPFFVMDYIHGEDLVAVRSAVGGPIPLEHALAIGFAAATGLHHAHTRRDFEGNALKLVHRDVSPSNVLVTYDGGVKLVDFGIAKATRKDGTRPSIRKGKVGYMSPEQCKGSPMDGRTDVFSLGIVLWELLAGARLFGGGDNEFAAMNRIVNHDAPSLREANDTIPPAVADVVHRALARKREDRFEDARAMAQALERAAESAGLRPSAEGLAGFIRDVFGSRPYPWESATPTHVAEPALEETDATRAVAAVPTPDVRKPSRPWMLWAILGGGLAFAGVLMVWAQASNEPDTPEATHPSPGAAASAESAPSTKAPTAPLETPDSGEPAPLPATAAEPPLDDAAPATSPPEPPSSAAPTSLRRRTRSKTKPKTRPKPKTKPETKPSSVPKPQSSDPASTFDPDGLGPVRTVLK